MCPLLDLPLLFLVQQLQLSAPLEAPLELGGERKSANTLNMLWKVETNCYAINYRFDFRLGAFLVLASLWQSAGFLLSQTLQGGGCCSM